MTIFGETEKVVLFNNWLKTSFKSRQIKLIPLEYLVILVSKYIRPFDMHYDLDLIKRKMCDRLLRLKD